MEQDVITLDTGKIYPYLHHVDLRSYGRPRMLSVYLGVFNEGCVLFDCGSSLDSKKALRYFKKSNIPLSSLKYLVTTHHHFDHNGGIHLLYEEVKKHNPDVKILTNQITKELLNDFEQHLARARRTYGSLVGTMKPIEENAFELIEPSQKFPENPKNIEFIDTFMTNGFEVKLGILKTPGHTPDHQSPILVKDGEIDFIFWGESVGTIYHTTKLLTTPTSMPTYYNHEQYMNTLQNLKKLAPKKAGFGHFGVINGNDNIRSLLLEHEEFMKEFREKIIRYYAEKPKTRYVFDKILPYMMERTDLPVEGSSILNGIVLGVVYGMLMDLGYRKD